MAEDICWLRSFRERWWGSKARAESRSLMSGMAVGGRLGMKFFLRPRGMWATAAAVSVLRKKASPAGQEDGRGADRKTSSVWASKASQSALRKLVYVRLGGGGGGCRELRDMAIGRWSELRRTRGSQVASRDR